MQARQSLEETRWLLDLATSSNIIRGVVGWVPLASPEARIEIERMAGSRKLVGARHVLHDEADDGYMLRADFNAGLQILMEFDLVYDVLIFEKHLPQTIELVDRHPSQIFVLDHVAKPGIKAGSLQPWARNITELAKREHVFCKVSGMVSEADWKSWAPDDLRPYFEVVLDAFGADRLLFGSDWPVCLIASGYKRWADTVREWIAPLSEDEQRQILGETAIRVYGL